MTTLEQIQDELNRIGKPDSHHVMVTGHKLIYQVWIPESGIWFQKNERWSMEGMLGYLRTLHETRGGRKAPDLEP